MDKFRTCPGSDLIKRGYQLREADNHIVVFIERRIICNKCDLVYYASKSEGHFNESKLKEFCLRNIQNILKFVFEKIDHLCIFVDENIFSAEVLREMALEISQYYPQLEYFCIRQLNIV